MDRATQRTQEQIDSVAVWYHTLEIGGLETPGVYDMRPTVQHYHLPATIAGRDIVDIGASNGFFSFLFEQRGARSVVATDLPSFSDHDYPRWYLDQQLATSSAKDVEHVDWHQLHGGFTVAHSSLNSMVERVLCKVYDLGNVLEAQFDLAFCSNVLVHLRDPVGALEAIRAVVRPGGMLIVGTPIVHSDLPDISGARFLGLPKECAWWVPTPKCLEQWCAAAGFINSRIVDTFELTQVRGGRFTDVIGVVHAYRPR